MSKHETSSLRDGAATFYGVNGGRVLLNKMAEYFETQGTGVIHMLLDGELDVVRVSDGKGFWHEPGYDERPEI